MLSHTHEIVIQFIVTGHQMGLSVVSLVRLHAVADAIIIILKIAMTHLWPIVLNLLSTATIVHRFYSFS
jgi:hypothetical protein